MRSLARKLTSSKLAGPLTAGALFVALVGGMLLDAPMGKAAEAAVAVPPPAIDEPAGSGLETAVIAGGCFWGIQAVYQHVNGVESAVSGYSGGTVAKPSYEEVSSSTTGHAESVEIKFDPTKVSYGKILQIFFSVAHNPTELDFQGPDHGTQYRSAVFFTNDEHKHVAEAYIAQLDKAKTFGEPIVTEVTKFSTFYPAEDYHQDYAYLHPSQPYISWNDLPKVDNLKAVFPDVWRDKPTLVFASNAS
jgi:peptide-methionine (S)-S-oxide reductase